MDFASLAKSDSPTSFFMHIASKSHKKRVISPKSSPIKKWTTPKHIRRRSRSYRLINHQPCCAVSFQLRPEPNQFPPHKLKQKGNNPAKILLTNLVDRNQNWLTVIKAIHAQTRNSEHKTTISTISSEHNQFARANFQTSANPQFHEAC